MAHMLPKRPCSFTPVSDLCSGDRRELGHAPLAPSFPWPTWHPGTHWALAARARLCISTLTTLRTQLEIKEPQGLEASQKAIHQLPLLLAPHVLP